MMYSDEDMTIEEAVDEAMTWINAAAGNCSRFRNGDCLYGTYVATRDSIYDCVPIAVGEENFKEVLKRAAVRSRAIDTSNWFED